MKTFGEWRPLVAPGFKSRLDYVRQSASALGHTPAELRAWAVNPRSLLYSEAAAMEVAERVAAERDRWKAGL